MKLFWYKADANFDRDDRVLYLEKQTGGIDALHCYTKLLCIAARSNQGGAVYLADDIPHTAETLSRQWPFTVKATRNALEWLEKLKFIEVENGVIYICDWHLWQSVDTLNAIREYNREQQRKSRARRKEREKNVNDVSMTCQGKTLTCQGAEEKEIKKEKEKNTEKTEMEDICETVRDFFNITTTAFPKIKFLSDKQSSAIIDSVNRFGFEGVKHCFELAEDSDFLKGNNKQGWIAGFDWLIQPENVLKVLNGNYSSVYSPPSVNDGLESSIVGDEFIEAALSRGFE